MGPEQVEHRDDAGDVAGLVRAAAAGDEAAFSALVDRFANLVWSVVRSFRLGPADAADASQVTWLRLVEHLDRIREPERVGAWLATTARNEALRLLRQSGRALPSGLDFDAPSPTAPASAGPGPGIGLLTGERDAALWQAFSAIPDRCQALLRLLISDPPPSYEEISSALAMPVGSIGPTRARCLGKLRRKAALIGITAAATDSE